MNEVQHGIMYLQTLNDLLAGSYDPFEATQQELRYTVLRHGGGVGFVLGDYPCRPVSASLRPSQLQHAPYPGMDEADTFAFLPLSPNSGLMVTTDSRFSRWGEIWVSDARVRRLNGFALATAKREVVLPSTEPDVFEAGVDALAVGPFREALRRG